MPWGFGTGVEDPVVKWQQIHVMEYDALPLAQLHGFDEAGIEETAFVKYFIGRSWGN